ncbi:ADP-ribosylation factor-like protein 15a isoform X1 [Cynoglossus semilaevis]|uniref:ADP-ribosylation factor-like protein 15 n=1 Tax=Cynoglossus semilaevis TaxID=244447 RepID=A0A3P8X359_CYNSE|nr:ADP-ribosylation factor-like protein 15 isoform X1 [Cynoglossus semilaevis]
MRAGDVFLTCHCCAQLILILPPTNSLTLEALLVCCRGIRLLVSTMSEHMQLAVALCRIGLYTCFRALCCKGPPPPRPEYDVVCIGLTGAGKTSLLSRLCSESSDNVGPTTGFSIKAVPFPNAILNVKELGGADNIKKYWSRYYQGSQGVIFVLDSASSDEDLEAARNELHSALQHPQLCTLPFLILANHQDKPAARTPSQLSEAEEEHFHLIIRNWGQTRLTTSHHLRPDDSYSACRHVKLFYFFCRSVCVCVCVCSCVWVFVYF